MTQKRAKALDPIVPLAPKVACLLFRSSKEGLWEEVGEIPLISPPPPPNPDPFIAAADITSFF